MKDETLWLLAGLGVLWLIVQGQQAAPLPALPVAAPDVPALPMTEAPSAVSATDRGATNPLTAIVGWLGTIIRPQTTLPGNAPVVPALPAGPAGAISPTQGGTPGTPPIVGEPGIVPLYSVLYDTPWAYFDPITGISYTH